LYGGVEVIGYRTNDYFSQDAGVEEVAICRFQALRLIIGGPTLLPVF
jgi:hypothetical protein